MAIPVIARGECLFNWGFSSDVHGERWVCRGSSRDDCITAGSCEDCFLKRGFRRKSTVAPVRHHGLLPETALTNENPRLSLTFPREPAVREGISTETHGDKR